MATPKTTREAWLDAGLSKLADGGPDAVRVEELARTLGVTKGGFYWHFADRPTFLGLMLDRWEQRAVADVIDRLEAHAAPPADRLRELFGIASAAIGAGGMDVELAIRDWARRDRDVATRIAAVDERRMTYMRSLFGQLTDDPLDAEARCLTAYALYIGTHFLAEPRGHAAALARALDDLLVSRRRAAR